MRLVCVFFFFCLVGNYFLPRNNFKADCTLYPSRTAVDQKGMDQGVDHLLLQSAHVILIVLLESALCL